ncbi:MAG TPA: hypothetical protein VHZ29_18135 [Rhizomicrobium sp.]|jgi:hypothetical protein|nr:hypothetical protein [Rhizomicrobium sp.]
MPTTLTGALALYGLIVVWLTLVIPMAMSWIRVRAHIEQLHPAQAQEFNLAGWRTFEQRLAYRNFVWAGYRKAGDPALSQLIGRARLMTALCFVFLVTMVSLIWTHVI